MKHIPTELLEDIVRRLVEDLHPERIILFGSHAYGEPDEMSDIDLLIVVSESDEPRHHRARKAYGCLRGLTAPTELIVLTQQEIEQATRVPTSLVNRAVHQGRVLYGRSEA
jgi:predicted nucleotidyltransferase